MVFPKSLVFTVVSAGFGRSAFAGPVYENASGGTMTFYGQLSPAYAGVADGEETEDNFADGDWVKLSAGQGSMVADDAAEITLAAIGFLHVSVPVGRHGSFFFREEGGALSGTTLGDVFDDFDRSRRSRIRYDSPNLLSASGQDLTLARRK